MDFNTLVDGGTSFFREHTLWALLTVVAIGALLYWKPKGMFKLSLVGLAVGAIIYVFSFLADLTSRGIDETEKFTTTPDVKVD